MNLFHRAGCCEDCILVYFVGLGADSLGAGEDSVVVLKQPSMKRAFQSCVHIFPLFSLLMPLRKQILTADKDL